MDQLPLLRASFDPRDLKHICEARHPTEGSEAETDVAKVSLKVWEPGSGGFIELIYENNAGILVWLHDRLFFLLLLLTTT